ncbi:hypothetical protein ACIG53_25815 [Streptomyces bauhiniae]|uniref:hypothetical protein n=1 Tax=Streptomyces bauhiniae TaxID=2340725 RepID=UPI0037D75E9F
MTLKSVQNALFKIYLNPGYRLAHRLDPRALAAHMCLTGDEAELVQTLLPAEVEQFAMELKAKEMLSLSMAMPVTFRWLEEHCRRVLREYEDFSTYGRRSDRWAAAQGFVSYLEECVDFYDAVPPTLPAVAQLEYLLLTVRDEQENRAGTVRPAPSPPVPRPSWDSLYWKPAHTHAVHSSTDALSVVLGKKDMRDAGDPTWVVIAPAPHGRVPRVLRITAPAFHLINALEQPRSAKQLYAYAQTRDLNVSEQALRALVERLSESGVLGAHHLGEGAAGE